MLLGTIWRKSMSKKTRKPTSYKAAVEIGRDSIVLTLPRKAADYLHLTENDTNEVFVAEVNNVIQISATPPNMSIPILSVTEDGFMPQDQADQENEAAEVQPE
jgi:hypothetical protein